MTQLHTCKGVATTVRRGSTGTLRVTYHSTEVVNVDREGFVTLNSGGWRTATTKVRMNQAARQYDLGYHVFQRKGDWFVDRDGVETPFSDGMRFRA